MPPGAPVRGLREASYVHDTNARRHGLAARLEDDCEINERIECLTAILAEGSDDFGRTEQSRIVAGCHFDLRRIRAARYDVSLAMENLESVKGSNFEHALRAMDSISRYETRALSKRKKALRKSPSDGSVRP
jgi:hypothetical protein